MILYKISMIALLVSCLNANAASKIEKVNNANQPKVLSELHPLMYQMLNDILALQPYMFNEKRFESKESKREIEKYLTDLSTLSPKVIKQKLLQTPTYRVSGEALNQQIVNSLRAFKGGNFKYARWALAAVPTGCASCHTQGVSAPKPLWTLSASDLTGIPIERAEFLFSTRNYEPAEEIYNQIIRTYSTADKLSKFQDVSDLERALKREITIWLRIRRDLKSAKTSLERDLENKNLPTDTQQLMRLWLKQMATIAKSESNQLKFTDKQLLDYARANLPGDTGGFLSSVHPDLVNYLWISGLLYDRLNKNDLGELAPEYLYWLGIIDLGLNNEFFYSLGSTYLRDCITRYARNPMSRRCYGEYEIQIAQMYSGSRGTDIPADVQEDLRKLKLKAGAE